MLPSIPYELTSSDEKFLQEATKLIGSPMSDLDDCHHRVVMKLRKSCHELNAEQLGKLAVMLLNCQSISEGRKLFECTQTMSLKDCTHGMDSDTWNAYHLVTNRAKAVCVASRQEQFRGLTELTVNKLMHSGEFHLARGEWWPSFNSLIFVAHEQISMMNTLSQNQDKLHKVTATALVEMANKNEKLLDQQNQMLEMTVAHRSTIENNLHELMREKGLIRSGQVEVARMIDQLKQKLDESLVNLKQQSKESKQNHDALAKDLEQLHDNAFSISEKLSDTTEFILSQNELTSTQFDQTIRQLAEINETIVKLSSLLNTLESDIDRKLAWIADKVGGTDVLLANVNLILQHFVYLLLGMLLLVFVNAKPFYRVVFILTVPTNFSCTLLRFHNLEMIELTGVIGAIYVGNLIRSLLFPFHLTNPFLLKGAKLGETCEVDAARGSEPIADESNEAKQDDEFDDNQNQTATKDYSYVAAFRRRDRRERSATPSFYYTQDNNSNHSRRWAKSVDQSIDFELPNQ